jgi:hypothetical protein
MQVLRRPVEPAPRKRTLQSRFDNSAKNVWKFKVRLVGPGVVARHRKFKDLYCQTVLTATTGIKGNLLHCETGNRNAQSNVGRFIIALRTTPTSRRSQGVGRRLRQPLLQTHMSVPMALSGRLMDVHPTDASWGHHYAEDRDGIRLHFVRQGSGRTARSCTVGPDSGTIGGASFRLCSSVDSRSSRQISGASVVPKNQTCLQKRPTHPTPSPPVFSF